MKLLSLIVYISLKAYKKASKISHNIRWKRKVKKLLELKSSKKLTNTQVKEIKSFYKGYGVKNVNVLWHQYYSDGNNNFSKGYIPENFFYMYLEPKLNRGLYFPALEDKNLLERLFPKVKQPETILKNINGFYYGANGLIDWGQILELCNTGENLVLKPTLETGGGKNVILFSCENGITNNGQNSLKSLLEGYKKDFIIQRVVKQHPKMSALNETSLNTFRVMTFLKNSDAVVLSIIVRMGREGAFTDNSTGGGLSCGIDEQGNLRERGFQNNTGKIFMTTDSGIPFKEITLPFVQKVKEIAIEVHKTMPFFRLISWDFAIDNLAEVVLIENNVNGQDINFHQFNNGPVLSCLLDEIK